MKRFTNAFWLFFWAIKNHKIFREDIFHNVTVLMTMVFDVTNDERPRITHLSTILAETKEEIKLVQIWAGYGGDTPFDRIDQLKRENALLRIQLKKMQEHLHLKTIQPETSNP